MTAMLINDLINSYAAWLFASVMFIWLGSALHRAARNSLNSRSTEAEAPGVPVPSLPDRAPTIHLMAA